MSGALAVRDTGNIAASVAAAAATIGQIDDVDQLREVIGQAEGWQSLLKSIGEATEKQNLCAELKLRAIRRAGVLMEQAKVPSEHHKNIDRYIVPEGMGTEVAKRWRRVGLVPEDDFSTYLTSCRTASSPPSVAGLLRFAPKFGGTRGFAHPPETVERARELRGEGLSYKQIAEVLDVSQSTVKAWLDANYRYDRRRKLSEQKHARSRKAKTRNVERLAAARRKAGDPIGEVAPPLRRTLEAIQAAADHADDPLEQRRIADLFGLAYALEDGLMRMMKGHDVRGGRS